MSNSKFWFNGRCSDEFGLRIGGEDNFGSPERIVTEYQVPGYNGAYIVDEGAYTNYLRQYRAALMRRPQLEMDMSAVKRWLQPDGEYHRLEDSYAPDVYRMARLTGGISTQAMGSSIRSVQFPITFTCRPQKFLKCGEWPLAFDAESGLCEIFNPTGFTAWPRISFTANEESYIEVVSIYDEIGGTKRGEVSFDTGRIPGVELIFDTQTTEAYWADGTSANDAVIFSGDLSLPEGRSVLLMEIGLAMCHVYPRWWRL